ncbi:hypothetical protein E6O75_ATG03809 [Venturia nashicola]|uniref:Uncharacterized protein n=1 Tax=Venturia nashicola TaxID=86259 RepID=A0A4Z1PJZ8_9PEZI|nr:hypothetical protein E6O75_ATG03809 [Venturia nashicola]
MICPHENGGPSKGTWQSPVRQLGDLTCTTRIFFDDGLVLMMSGHPGPEPQHGTFILSIPPSLHSTIVDFDGPRPKLAAGSS